MFCALKLFSNIRVRFRFYGVIFSCLGLGIESMLGSLRIDMSTCSTKIIILFFNMQFNGCPKINVFLLSYVIYPAVGEKNYNTV